MKTAKFSGIVKNSVRIAIAAAVIFVFMKNAFPRTEEAVVLESYTASSGSSNIALDVFEVSGEIDSGELSESRSQSAADTASESADVSSAADENESVSEAAVGTFSEPASGQASEIIPEPVSSEAEQPVEIESHPNAEESPLPETININTASSEELQLLKGIGEVKAAAIIAYREENGGFSSVDEIINVKGIGEKTLENIRDKITV